MTKLICVKYNERAGDNFPGGKVGEICYCEISDLGRYKLWTDNRRSILYLPERINKFFVPIVEFRNNKIDKILNE